MLALSCVKADLSFLTRFTYQSVVYSRDAWCLRLWNAWERASLKSASCTTPHSCWSPVCSSMQQRACALRVKFHLAAFVASGVRFSCAATATLCPGDLAASMQSLPDPAPPLLLPRMCSSASAWDPQRPRQVGTARGSRGLS
jgi:hypothetical protein